MAAPISERPTQAPQTNQPENPVLDQEQDFVEQTNQETIDNEPSTRDTSDREQATADKKLSLKERYKQLPRSKKLLAMVAAGTAGVVVGVLPYAGTLMGGNKYVETEDGMLVPENVATAPAVPGENTNDTQVTNPELAYATEKLASMREDSADELREKGMAVEIADEQTDASTSEELMGKFNADLRSVQKVAQTNPYEAEKMLVGVINPADQDDFDRMKGYLITGNYVNDDNFIPKYGMLSLVDWSDNYHHQVFKEVEPTGTMRNIYVTTGSDDFPEGLENQVTFRLDGGEWVVQKMVPAGDTDWIADNFSFNQSIPK